MLATVARDLRRGFGERFRIMRATSGAEALGLLRQLRTRGDLVAMLIADQRMPGMAGVTALRLASELHEATERMSALVGAVKTYAYMDRGDLVSVDLHERLETTLALLKHKLKHTTIQVERHYDRALPNLTVRGSELNQVWTNLLDNAIDRARRLGNDQRHHPQRR